jgi:preprotein translocase subunit SecA
VLEEDRLEDLIWGMIDETIEQAVATFLDPDFQRRTVAQWAQEQLGVPIDASRVEADDVQLATESIRDQARDEIRTTISRTVGEYIDPDMDRSEWDIRGLSKWASRYGASISQNQIKRMEPEDIEELIMASASVQIEKANLSAIEPLLDPTFPLSRLTEWARLQFGVDVKEEDLAVEETDANVSALKEAVRRGYRKREVTYPVQELLDATFGPEAIGDDAYAADRIVRWVNGKFNLDWSLEDVQSKNPHQLYDQLVALNEEWMGNGRLAQEIDKAVAEHEGEELVAWARQRFGAVMSDEHELLDGTNGDPRDTLLRLGRRLLRYELTRLEQVVLITALDDEWKDHMYEMDLLKSAIGLRGYAEKDPKVEYKREGMRMYGEMMDRLRERVTQTVFRARLGGGVSSVYRGIEARHDDAVNVGFSEDHVEGLDPQGEAARPQTFRREKPKVGRNDPCPCGSGKKYKKCCGK